MALVVDITGLVNLRKDIDKATGLVATLTFEWFTLLIATGTLWEPSVLWAPWIVVPAMGLNLIVQTLMCISGTLTFTKVRNRRYLIFLIFLFFVLGIVGVQPWMWLTTGNIFSIGGLIAAMLVVAIAPLFHALLFPKAARALRVVDQQRARLDNSRVYDHIVGLDRSSAKRFSPRFIPRLVRARAKPIIIMTLALGVYFPFGYFLTWIGVPILIALLVVQIPVAFAFMAARPLAQFSAGELQTVDKRNPVLIMRMFTDDILPVEGRGFTFPKMYWDRPSYVLEEMLSHGVQSCGPAVIIGDPRERLPRPGGAREYSSGEEWRSVVGGLIERSHLLLFVIGDSEHLKWEFETGVATAGSGAILIVVPPLSDRNALFERWQAFKELTRAVIGVRLPESISYRGRNILVVLFASDEPIVVASDDRSGWSYLLATRVAAALAVQRPVSTQQAVDFIKAQLPMLPLSSTDRA